ncbi:hypothetical protein KO533_11735 [Shewanella sp. NKUCC05_KAH]|uniref:hypothetical protein n=1 Tax=Shewanella sp. NKUCC05_KAH TaxID=2842126 RepID=UPI001C5A6BD6|nr:hypothetical protein [Shewanella sp. NKUCC05_KAH]MBW3527231.1 hypothetical protein [Shewanella sp. NKUCC05_KAH]
MAARLKGIILSVEDVLLNKGTVNENVFKQVSIFMKFLKLRGIQTALLSNQKWTVTEKQTGKQLCLFKELKQMFPELTIFSRHLDPSIPAKPNAASTAHVLDRMGWKDTEVVYIGSSDTDMRTAVNGNLLLLRATWYNNSTDYGFEFSELKQIARFIDTLCLREHFWSHEIKDGDFEFYALAPFSTMKAEFTRYSADARDAAKWGGGHPDFWLSALVTSLYFTGIHKRIDFIAAYPGHKVGVGNDKMNDDLMTFAKCFRKGYLHDLIERHTTALKSQDARNRGIALDHRNQLNTIKLNKLPTKNFKTVYKAAPLKEGKTVLLVDDICTKGYSFESARQYIERTGAKVIMVAWLKTINTDIEKITALGKFDPYKPNVFERYMVLKTYGYQKYLVDRMASEELSQQFDDFIKWDWPEVVL